MSGAVIAPSRRDPCRPDRRPAAANAMHQVRLRRLPPLRGGHRRRRGRLSTSARPAAPKASRAWRRLTGRAVSRSIRSTAIERPRRSPLSTKPLHRLHAVHPGLPGRRIVGAAKQMHTVIADAVHRLRPVRAALPGRLHRACGRHTGSAPAGTPGPRPRPTRPATRHDFARCACAREQRENDARLAAKAERQTGRSAEATSTPNEPAEQERKRAIIEAAMERARARKAHDDP